MKRFEGSLDTNIIMRFLTKDDGNKVAPFEKLVRKAEQSGRPYFVPEMVIAELVFTLSGKYYGMARKDISSLIMSLSAMPGIQIENISVILAALQLFAQRNIKFGDAMILSKVRANGAQPLYTFDKEHFSSLPDTVVLE